MTLVDADCLNVWLLNKKMQTIISIISFNTIPSICLQWLEKLQTIESSVESERFNRKWKIWTCFSGFQETRKILTPKPHSRAELFPIFLSRLNPNPHPDQFQKLNSHSNPQVTRFNMDPRLEKTCHFEGGPVSLAILEGEKRRGMRREGGSK